MAASTPFVVTITAVDKATASVQKIKASLASVTKPASDLKASFASFSKEAGLDRVAKSMKSVGTAAADTARQVASVITPLTTIAGIGSIAGIALLANEWGKFGAEVQRTSGVLGVSTQDLQAFRGAAKLAGLSADDMTGSLKSLGRTIEDATYGRNQDALVMMQKFGITLHRTKDGAVDATRALKEVANAIVAQKGNVQAQGLIAGAFGVESLLPLLQKGEKGIDEFVNRARSMGLVFDDKQLARGQQFNENMLKLEASATRLKYSFGDALAPAVQRVLDVVGRLVDKYGDVVASKVSEYVEKFANWIDHVDWDKTTSEIGKFVDAIGGVKGIAIAIAAISFAGPIASVLSLISNLTLLATTTVPTAVAALARLAGGPIMAAVLALLHSKDLNTGEDDYLKQHQAQPGQQWQGDPIGDRRRAGAADDAQTAGVVDRLTKMGWSKEQAAGLAANFWQESLFNPNAVGDNGHAYGIGQWHEDRQAEFKKLFGTDIRKSTLDQQLQFADYELRRGNEQKAGRALMGASSAQDAGSIVSRLYERPADAAGEAARRGQMAAAIDGKVHVHVDIPNAPPGTKASVRASGGATASARVGTSNVIGPSV
ncbi:phage tail tape measure protein [Paraburkholderia phymatum]|uniref:Putative membrane protein, phage K related n=1 Tax=Paraburkholderia phymatum (strain DSM 17167 / CIP 108236 / LMG 21445 / STM815) TaxID=391038 RepID=B2JCZ8_PARP8|nr:phage tail tape measure protein [Paraburkholderia phymatum]ACC71054.1 putative membrane protein, phage K related [Paraburkholderia phymatum STM815]